MREKLSTKFLVNAKSVELNPFVNDFLAQITIGAAKSLRGVDYIKRVEMHREYDDLTVKVNGEDVSITPFPIGIISSTIIGLASILKGVDNVESFTINVEVG